MIPVLVRDYWRRVELTAACFMLVAIVSLICTQIVLRAVSSPLGWAEEAGAYLFLWMIFLGAAAAYKRFMHIRIALADGAGEQTQRLFFRFANLVVIIVCVVILWNASGVIRMESNSMTTSLPIDLPRAWFYSVPLTYMAASILLTAIDFVFSAVLPEPAEEDIL